jgi:FAD-dependent halogenase
VTWDVVIVGGGPAGSTVSSILLRYDPTLRVLILEKAAFPRMHVGETLISEINVVLQEMGVYDTVDKAGFIRKYGVTFSWGGGDPWTLEFHEMKPIRALVDKFGGVQTEYTWHVDRARYDTLLLDHAKSLGAKHQQATVTSLIETDGRVTGVETKQGQHHARFVVDASGQMGLGDSRHHRELDPRLRNIAHWAYYKDFQYVPALNGTKSESRAWIGNHGLGWSWVFPIREDLASVGVVRRADEPRESPAGLLEHAAADCADLRALLDGATQVPYSPGAPLVHSISDFSYVSTQIWRPGLVRVGDAAGFVDPILSVGCHNAQTLGRILAYTLRSAMGSPDNEAALFDAYAEQVRDTLDAYRELTYYFYTFGGTKTAWWAEAQRLVQQSALPQLASGDRHAFLAFATGFAAKGAYWEPTAMFDVPLFDAMRRQYGADDAYLPTQSKLTADDVVSAVGPISAKVTYVPLDGTGQMVRALRVEMDGQTPSLVRRMHLPTSLAPLVNLIDGHRTVAALQSDLADLLDVGDEHQAVLAKSVRATLSAMHGRGMIQVA